MSELRAALIAEGPTDAILIEAALKAILDRPFVLNTIQPEATRPRMGTGWCGVLKWCRAFADRGFGSLADDPTLPGYDFFVLHVRVQAGKLTARWRQVCELCSQAALFDQEARSLESFLGA